MSIDPPSDTSVRHLPPELLNLAVWQAMPGAMRPPDRMREAATRRDALAPADAAALTEFAARTWRYFAALVSAAIDLGGVDGASQTAPAREIAATLPWLDRWTFEVLWGQAVRHAMM